MITKSKSYKLGVNGRVTAEGSAAEIRKLQKKTPGSTIYFAPGHKIGQRIGTPPAPKPGPAYRYNPRRHVA